MSTVPLVADGALVDCTQNVSPTLESTRWCTSTCPLTGVRATALSQSLPTANTQLPAATLAIATSGAPVDALAPAEAPMPDVLVNATTVSDPWYFVLLGVDVTVTLVSVPGALAYQISEVPSWAF